MWFSVFTNWTGIVVEVKRGQLKGVEGGVGGFMRAAVPYIKRRLTEWTNIKSAHIPLQNHTLHIHIQWLFSSS